MAVSAETTQEELLQAAARGDAEAFSRIVEQHQSMVSSLAYAITGDFSLSEDIAQETFLTAWRRLSQLRDQSRLPMWLRAITRNLAKDALRKKLRDPLAGATDLDGADAAEANPSDVASHAEREHLCWEVVGRLPETYRHTLVLFYREGRSVRETAERLGVSEDCAKQRLARARAMLRTRLTALVEDTLGATRPGTAFTVGVIAALPSLAVGSASAQTAALTGVAVKGVVAGAKAGMGMAVAGTLIGMTGGLFGMWNSIRNAPTLAARRYMLDLGAMAYSLVWGFLGVQSLCLSLFLGNPFGTLFSTVGLWLIYIPALIILIRSGNKRYAVLSEEDSPEVETQDHWKKLLSNPYLCLPLSMPFFYACFVSEYFPGGWIAFAVLISHLGFISLYRYGAAISRDEVVFAETAPRQAADNVVENRTSTHSKWNDFFALTGGIVGSGMSLAIPMIQAGQYGWAAGFLAAMAVVAAVGFVALRRLPKQRGLCFLAALSAAGVVYGGTVGLQPMAWIGVLETHFAAGLGGIAWRYVAGAGFFALYTLIGVGLFFMERGRAEREA